MRFDGKEPKVGGIERTDFVANWDTAQQSSFISDSRRFLKCYEHRKIGIMFIDRMIQSRASSLM